ncbi:Holliday junction resolvase [Agreia sp. Leaf244]|uniref:crossover junction endodeoxyribonuclease RuvC n=1 Tax=unclassified Agreia TaxID=2641148 RepID=UPI0006F3B475|nr:MULTISPECIES: crossover junction endodeoxyribonuclease RuvC [unclassified Agreia]KQO06569.1 Holliday junction resolvase [Agreia sp. Leaf244]KQP55568.1 Holliday junction resolvase [Agreia sp. Leaf283]
MRVLGIDPGLTRCGVGVVDVTANRVATLVAVTVVRTPPTMDLDQRLLGIALGLDELISEHRPESIAIERVFAQHNVSTVMGTAQVSGIALLAAARHGIPVSLHTPTEVKASITGYGQAEKKQVGTMVAKILGLAEIPKPADAADALALAICHAWRSPATSSARPAADAASGSGMTRAQQAWRAAEKAAGAPRRLAR